MIYSLPEAFITKIRAHFPDRSESILSSFESSKPLCIRVNTLKSNREEIILSFQNEGIEYESVDWCEDAFIIKNKTSREITEKDLYKDGKIYIQSLSSMIPAIELAPLSSDKVLDMAAAPGSKTSHLAAMMENGGELIANDIDRNRMFKLRAIMKQLGVTNVTTTSFPGQSIWQKYPEYFDKVLLDAPCSMEGRFDLHDPKSIEHWSPKKVKNLGKLQQWLLRSAVSATKVGGIMVYSTCTISPEENEYVIEWILEKEKGNIEVLETKRIFPNEKMEAFYVAKIKKLNSNIYHRS